jgi:plasmid stabilization system protein ParE
MSYSSVLSERARKELQHSWEWYEDRQTGLGDRFVKTVFEKLKQIEDNPAKGMQRNGKYREATIKIFPYLIIYRIETEDNCVFVHSVFHTSRNPKKKYRS